MPWKIKQYDTIKKWHGHAPNINKLQIKNKQITRHRKNITFNIHHDSIPWVPNASKGNLNLSLLQDFMVVSFVMQSPVSYCHKHITVSAWTDIIVYWLPYLFVPNMLTCNWTHTYIISQGTTIPCQI